MKFWSLLLITVFQPLILEAQEATVNSSCNVYGKKATISFSQIDSQLVLGVSVWIHNPKTRCEKSAPLEISLRGRSVVINSLRSVNADASSGNGVLLDVAYGISKEDIQAVIDNIHFFSSITITFADRDETYPFTFYYNTVRKTAQEFLKKIEG